MEQWEDKANIQQKVRERAVRMVLEHEREYGSRWAAICSIASKIGCTAQTLRTWVLESGPGQVAAAAERTAAETVGAGERGAAQRQ
jgi:transposase